MQKVDRSTSLQCLTHQLRLPLISDVSKVFAIVRASGVYTNLIPLRCRKESGYFAIKSVYDETFSNFPRSVGLTDLSRLFIIGILIVYRADQIRPRLSKSISWRYQNADKEEE